MDMNRNRYLVMTDRYLHVSLPAEPEKESDLTGSIVKMNITGESDGLLDGDIASIL